jgi:hypothetical protein
MTNDDRDLVLELMNENMGNLATACEELLVRLVSLEKRTAKLEERMGPEIDFPENFFQKNFDAD